MDEDFEWLTACRVVICRLLSSLIDINSDHRNQGRKLGMGMMLCESQVISLWVPNYLVKHYYEH
jgi:hypothetical protein